MFEPDLKYCPECGDEYRPEISRCAVCGADLLLGVEMAEKAQELEARRQRMASMELRAAEDLVPIHRADLREVKNLQELLADALIPSRIAADDSSCGKGCCASSFFLLVRQEHGREAAQLLKQEFARLTALDQHDLSLADAVFDPDAGTATCPACGCRFATTTTTCPDCGLCFG